MYVNYRTNGKTSPYLPLTTFYYAKEPSQQDSEYCCQDGQESGVRTQSALKSGTVSGLVHHVEQKHPLLAYLGNVEIQNSVIYEQIIRDIYEGFDKNHL